MSPNFGSTNSVFNRVKLSKDPSSPVILESIPSSASSGITFLVLHLGFLDQADILGLDPTPFLATDDSDNPSALAELSRKRQTTAQSSVLEVGYLNFQA
jgi:hypothetical protein